MLENQNKIDELFNDFLHDYEKDVPAFVWNNLKDELKAKRRMRVLFYIKAIAASVALFITFGLGYFVSDLGLNQNNKVKILEENKVFPSDKLTVSDNRFDIEKANSLANQAKINNKKKDLYKYTFELKKTNSKFQVASYDRIKIYDTNQLYRKYQFINKIFTVKSDENKKNKSLVTNNSRERKSNQLLTDTLLLEKENLHEGGFLLQNEEKKSSAWSFGTKFSPVVSVGNSASNEINETSGSDVKGSIRSDKPDMNFEEKALTSYTGGVNVNYHLSKRISIESGIFYAQKKQGADNLIGSQDNEFGGDNMTVYTPGGTQSIQQINNKSVLMSSLSMTYYALDANYVLNAEYVELPLIIRYKLIDQKVSLDVLSGVSTNFLVKNNTSIILNNQELWSGQNEDINSILYGATFGLGVNYNFYQNLTFNVEPTFKYSILPENSAFSQYPYSFAVFAGFSYRFK